MGIFSDAKGQLTLQSVEESRQFLTPLSSHACHCYLQVWKGLDEKQLRTRIDVYETLCPQQMLVYKGGKIKNWVGSAEMSHLQNRCLKISG